MKKNTYSEYWLHIDLDNMAYIFEYCDKYCMELYKVKIDKIKFLTDFMSSNARYLGETAQNGNLLAQAAYDTVKDYIIVDCNMNYEQYRADDYVNPEPMSLYWVGQMYAYLHYYGDLLSKDLIKRFSIEQILDFYRIGHEMSFSNCMRKLGVEIID